MKYTLAFDVYGTLIDTSGIYTALEEVMGAEAKPFMMLWRNKQLEYSFRRAAMNLFVDFSVCTKEAFEFCCQTHKITFGSVLKESLLNAYNELPAFADVETNLQRLKADGHRLFAFSNGGYVTLHMLLKNAKIFDYFEGIVSVEEVQMFKPSPLVYAHFNHKSKSKPEMSWLISGNPFDVMGALNYGMHAAWVKRSEAAVFDPWGMEPTQVVSSLSELKF